MDILLHPTYFGSIETFVVLSKATKLVFEKQDNYQKQTYRNRTYIATPEGRLLLNIPIKHIPKERHPALEKAHQKYKEVCIENAFPWQRTHWKSIQNAYRTSPFFEFYEDDLAPLYEKEYTFLMDFNLDAFSIVKELLELDLTPTYTERYEKTVDDLQDYRQLAVAKQDRGFQHTAYTQVLEKHHGFLPNLSVIDLLFNEGTNALSYLEQQAL